MNYRILLGLLGVLINAVGSEFNDQVTSVALVDVRGALGISHDPGTWIESLYVSAEIIGMMLSPWFLVTLTLRRFTLFVIALDCTTSVLIPFAPDLTLLYVLRWLQGLSGGLSIPLLMTTALRALPPAIRLWGLAIYALSATVTPNLAAALGALWVDVIGDWRFVFFEALPFTAVAAVLCWYGLPQDPPQYQRFRIFDWRGALLGLLGFTSLSTMLIQGDRFDWFNSQTICVLGLISLVSIPLFLVNEWFQEVPLIKLQLLGRRNFAYGGIALFMLLLIILSASSLPISYLTQVQGYRPIQAYVITLEIALGQLVMLPLMAVVLNIEWVDSRVVSFIGMACMLTACIGDFFLTSAWNRQEFYLWQAFQMAGEAMIVMPLLMMATNSVVPQEGPFASGLVNTPRAISEAVGIWLLQLIDRWRGGLHSNRLVDQAGRDRFGIVQGAGVLPRHPPPLLADGRERFPGSLAWFDRAVHAQTVVLTMSDAFVVIGALVVLLMLVLLILPVRTYPPRIALAKK